MFASLAAFRVTDGERSVLISYVGVSIVGACLAFSVGLTLDSASALSTYPNLYDAWLAISGAIGAASALYLGRGFLGRSDVAGAIRVFLALPVISLTASLIAGTFALPIYGTMFGPLALFSTFVSNPLLAGVWITSIFGAHAAHAAYQQERDTIFTAIRRDGIPT